MEVGMPIHGLGEGSILPKYELWTLNLFIGSKMSTSWTEGEQGYPNAGVSIGYLQNAISGWIKGCTLQLELKCSSKNRRYIPDLVVVLLLFDSETFLLK